MKLTFIKPVGAIVVLLVGVFLAGPGCATSKGSRTPLTPEEARAALEELRSDFNADKIRVLNQVMKLSVDEADKFWPIYRQYQQELATVTDRKLELLIEFMRQHKAGPITDPNAKELAAQWLQNAQAQLDLWKKYQLQISDAISPVRAAQFLQIENRMAIFVDLNLATEVPVIGIAPTPQ